MVLAVESDEGELTEAYDAEERLVEEMRLLRREALRVGPRPERRRRSGRFVNALRCIAKVKKTLVTYEIRRNRGPGAAISVRDAAGASFRARGEERLERLLESPRQTQLRRRQ